MKKTDNISLVFSFLAGLLLLFLLAPLIGLFLSTTPLSLFETAQEPEVQKSIWLTISSSMAATLIFSIGAIPLAYLLARKKFIFKRILLGIINIPVIIPHSAAGIALLGIISRDTL